MSVRALLPIAAIGGLAYFFHSKEKKGDGESTSGEDPELDFDPLEELVKEKKEEG
jgi:hypothetical protein